MEPVEIEDNDWSIEVETFSGIENLENKIANKTLGKLGEDENILIFPRSIKDSKDVEQKQLVLQEVDGTYHSGNVAGFLGYGDEQLIIHSRFDPDGTKYFTQYILEKVIHVPNIFDLPLSAGQKGDAFDLLLLLFPYQLRATMRKGLFRQYVHRQQNDSNVKGPIDIARHIRKNVPFMGNIAYNQRELSYDNHLTELVRHTIEFIRRKPYGSGLLSKIQDEVRLIVGATPNYRQQDRHKIIDANRRCPIRHAYFHEYLALQRLCLGILNHRKHEIGTGSQRVYGILFDISWVWEEYINTLIGKDFHHPENKTKTYPQPLFDIGENVYPDFISQDAENRVIADAKYRPKDNIRNKDYLQLLAYMFRFGSEMGYYLYPERGEEQNEVLHLNQGSTFDDDVRPRKDVVIKKYGLKISSEAESYDDFVREMRLNEVKFTQGIT